MPEEKRGESGKSQHMHVFVYIKNENAANGRGASGKTSKLRIRPVRQKGANNGGQGGQTVNINK